MVAVVMAAVVGLRGFKNQPQSPLVSIPAATPSIEERPAVSSTQPSATPAANSDLRDERKPAPGALSSSTPIPSPTITNTPKTEAYSTLDADPALFLPPNYKPSPTTRDAGPVDYNKVFSPSKVDTKARILNKPEPGYTETARKKQIIGTVVLHAVFSSEGSVTNITVISGLADGLTEQAIAAAKKIQFSPAIKDGRRVSVWMELQYDFNPHQ